MKLNFDTENTVSCPKNIVSTRYECYECNYFEEIFVHNGKRVFVLNCNYNELNPEISEDMFVGVK